MIYNIFYRFKKNIYEFSKFCFFISYICFSSIFENKIIYFDNQVSNENINDKDKNNKNKIFNENKDSFVNDISDLSDIYKPNKNEYNYQLCYLCNKYINYTMFLYDDKTFCSQICRKKYSFNLIK